jgi:hypothetical protein
MAMRKPPPEYFSKAYLCSADVPLRNSAERASTASRQILFCFEGFIGRGGEIRTPDPLVPNQMRYQTALRPDNQRCLGHNAILGKDIP